MSKNCLIINLFFTYEFLLSDISLSIICTVAATMSCLFIGSATNKILHSRNHVYSNAWIAVYIYVGTDIYIYIEKSY